MDVEAPPTPQVIPNDAIADVAIIGAGPAGLFATFYAGLRQLSVTLIDSLRQLGGQLATLYPEKYIYDAPGFPRVLAKDLVAQLVTQAMQASPSLRLGCSIERIITDSPEIALSTRPHDRPTYGLIANDQVIRCRSVLIASGVGTMKPKRLPLPEASQYEGRGLHYVVSDPSQLAGRRVLIVGGGDSAVDWANALSTVATRVTLIHRRQTFRAQEQNVATMLAGPVKIHLNHELVGLQGNDTVTAATIEDTRNGIRQTLPIDVVLVNIGFDSTLRDVKNWDLTLSANAIAVDRNMQTSRPGIFAAGDVCTYPGKLKLIATGFGEAATAINHIKQYLEPEANLFPGHSTSVATARLKGI